MTNLELLDYSGRHPVPIIDSYYNKDKIVITPTKEQSNELMAANASLIELITVFNYLNGEGRGADDSEIQNVGAKRFFCMGHAATLTTCRRLRIR